VLRRSSPRPVSAGPIEFDGVEVDPGRRVATVNGNPVELTPKEFDVLAFFVGHPRLVFSRSDLLERVWGSSEEWQDPATVTVHVRRIRMNRKPLDPRWLQTVWGRTGSAHEADAVGFGRGAGRQPLVAELAMDLTGPTVVSSTWSSR
jgi:DNA-binding response OmpR family regulator